MHVIFAVFSLSVIVCGCSERSSQPLLEPLARGLSEAMRPAYADFTLEIRAMDNGNRVTLHCVLKNVSIVATAIDVDASTLPWRNPEHFDINAVAANGDAESKSLLVRESCADAVAAKSSPSRTGNCVGFTRHSVGSTCRVLA
jgi:hypothetical protein